MNATRLDITIGEASTDLSQRRNKTTIYTKPSPANSVGDGVGFKGYSVKNIF